MSKRKWEGRIFLGRKDGRQTFYWVGRFDLKRDRDEAVAKARTERPWEKKPVDRLTCDEWADRYLARCERRNKASSVDTARLALKRFRKDFGSRAIDSIGPVEAEDWVDTVPKATVPVVVSMLNYAVRMQVIDRNPFATLGGGRGRGRADKAPPTVKELDRLLDSCDVLGAYADQFRALLLVGAYTGARPGELHALRWADIDFARHRVEISRRLYRGQEALPKSNRPRTVALPPPAEAVLLKQPTRGGDLVFLSRMGCQLTASIVSPMWARVKARACLEFDIYTVTRHLAVNLLWRLGLSEREISSQLGWSERSVEHLLRVYGHRELTALDAIDRLYAGGVDPLRNTTVTELAAGAADRGRGDSPP
jgi:integrase